MSKLLDVLELGQSIWLDYIDRALVEGGGLEGLVARGLRGVTSNPTIFYKAITGGSDYDESVRDLMQANHGVTERRLYELLTLEDIQGTADILRSVYDASRGSDGFVSLEVSPHLAHDSGATVEAARHLWSTVRRPNLMIKVPATVEGLGAIEQLIGEGINVNVTLLFSVERYEAVFEAFVRGLAANPEPAKVASVASFFVSRVDNKVDRALDEIGTPQALELKGKIAVANAKMAYQRFKALCRSEAFQRQQARGARLQRPLWGSTSTKNPDYSDVLYVESLIGPDTVNTLPPATLEAFEHHGEARSSLDVGVDAARRHLDALQDVGVDLAEVTRALEDEGVAAFTKSYDDLLAALRAKLAHVAKEYAQP